MLSTRAALVAAFFGVLTLIPCARADVSISVYPDSVQVTARDATVAEVLAGLKASNQVEHQSLVPLDRTISGIYRGTLREVVSRMLGGYDFILKTSNDRLSLVILRESGATGRVGAQGASPPRSSPGDAAGVTGTSSEQAAAQAPGAAEPNAGPAIAVTPPPAKPKPPSLGSMLFNAAQASAAPPSATQPGGAPSSATNSVPVPSMPSPEQIAALTQKAASQLDALVASLQSLRR